MNEQEKASTTEEQAKSEEATRMGDAEAEAIVGGASGLPYANPDDDPNTGPKPHTPTTLNP